MIGRFLARVLGFLAVPPHAVQPIDPITMTYGGWTLDDDLAAMEGLAETLPLHDETAPGCCLGRTCPGCRPS